jgi:hypothetical protein
MNRSGVLSAPPAFSSERIAHLDVAGDCCAAEYAGISMSLFVCQCYERRTP